MKKILFLLCLLASNAWGVNLIVSNSNCPAYTTTTNPQTGDLVATCVTAGTATPYCQLAASKTTILAGESVNLNTGCSPVPTSYQWVGVNTSAAYATVTPTVTTTYSVTGSNQYGQGNTSSVTVQVTQPVNDCQGLQNGEIPLNWGPGYLQTFGMSAGQSYSFAFTPSDYGQITTIYGGTQKVMSISTKKCDFAAELANDHCLSTGTDPRISYSTSTSRYYCPVTPGQTYYVNIRNAVLSETGYPYYPIQDSCSGACQFSITY